MRCVAFDAMSLERFGELLGWPKDMLGRYRKQSELRQFRGVFAGYLGGVTRGEPPYSATSLQSALGAFLQYLWESQPRSAEFLKYVDSSRASSLIERYESEPGA